MWVLEYIFFCGSSQVLGSFRSDLFENNNSGLYYFSKKIHVAITTINKISKSVKFRNLGCIRYMSSRWNRKNICDRTLEWWNSALNTVSCDYFEIMLKTSRNCLFIYTMNVLLIFVDLGCSHLPTVILIGSF